MIHHRAEAFPRKKTMKHLTSSLSFWLGGNRRASEMCRGKPRDFFLGGADFGEPWSVVWEEQESHQVAVEHHIFDFPHFGVRG